MIQTASSVDEIGAEAWDALSAGQSFQSARWYRFGERAMQGCQAVYLLLARHGEALARAAFWVVREEPLPLPAGLRVVLAPLLRKWPLLICRTPFIDLPGIVLPAQADLRRDAIQALTLAAQEEAKRHKVSFIMFPYLEPETAQEKGWANGFTPVDLPGPPTCLKVEWPDFETYLHSLKRAARNYHHYNILHSDEWGITIKAELQFPREQVIPLIRKVEKHHRSAPNPWVAGILANTGAVEATWFSATAHGKPAGCLLTFREQQDSLLSLIGLDYNVPHTYFMLVYAALEHAIGKQSRVIWGGSGAYPFKQSLGFGLTRNTWAVFASQQPLIQKVGMRLARWAT